MKFYIALIFLITINLSSCLRPLERQSYLFGETNNAHNKIKIVNYLVKNDDVFTVKTVPVKHLNIEPFDDWVAKGVFDGDNYNKTGHNY